MPFDKEVYENVCKPHGHHITTLTTNKIWDDKTKVYFEEIQTLCNVCGQSLDEMRTPPVLPKVKRPRKPKVEAPVEVQQ
jgi:hypothetical protein